MNNNNNTFNAILTEEDKKKKLSSSLKKHFKDVTDFNYDEIANQFVDNGFFKTNMPFEQVMNDCIEFMAVYLANK